MTPAPRPLRRALVAVAVTACTSSTPDPIDSADDDTDVVEGRVGPEYSGDTCPALPAGDLSFQSSGDDRGVHLVLPTDPVGAPVVFVWHWLGGSGTEAANLLGWSKIARDDGVIVVAPESDPANPFEWDFFTNPQWNPDLVFFDDLLSCLWQEYDVDLDRVYATGMSAGGLMTSLLTTHRTQWLAATAPLSGGTDATAFPETEPIPVLLTWGGPTDTYSSYSFDAASKRLSALLEGNGHFVVECVHDGGHTVPNGSTLWVWQFLRDHPLGLDAEPYAAGLPDAFPSWCAIP